MEIYPPQKERVFTLIGKNCISCTKMCGVLKPYHTRPHAYEVELLVNGKRKTTNVCSHKDSPTRGRENSPGIFRDINQCRICLVHDEHFDKSARVEIPL